MAEPHTLCSVAALAPGDHACHLYDSIDERLGVLTRFVHEGLVRGERVLCLEDGPDEIAGLLRARGTDPDAYIDRGQLRVLAAHDFYLAVGTFDPDRVRTTLEEECTRAVDDGYTALRATAPMTWALHGTPGSDRLVEYEHSLSALFRSAKVTGLCQYDARRFGSKVLEDVADAHSTVIYGVGSDAEALGLWEERFRTEVGSGVLRLTGSVDVSCVDSLAAAVSSALEDAGDLSVDMGGLLFIDVAGLRVLYHAALRLAPQGRHVRLVAPPSIVTKVVAILGWEDHIQGVPQVTAALH